MRNIIDTVIILLAFVAGAAFVLVSDSPLSAQANTPDLTRSEVIQLIANVDGDGLNLRGVDLSGVDLSFLDLSHADLVGSNLVGVNLIDTNLTGADLRQADLTTAVLGYTIFRDANLSDLDLRFVVTLGDMDLQAANLSGNDMWGWDLSDSDLSGANLSGVNLTGADLSRAELYSTNLTNANLRHADLDRAEYGDLILVSTNFEYANVRYMKHRGEGYRFAIFTNVVLPDGRVSSQLWDMDKFMFNCDDTGECHPEPPTPRR